MNAVFYEAIPFKCWDVIKIDHILRFSYSYWHLVATTQGEDNLSYFILHRYTRDGTLFRAPDLTSISPMLPQAVTEKPSTG